MLKNKEKRDTLLLLFMAGVVILFIIYLLIPFGKKNSRSSNQTGDNNQITVDINSNSSVKKKNWEELGKELEDKLKNAYVSIKNSNCIFMNLDIKVFREILDQFDSEILNKFYRFSFYDLSEILNLKFPSNYSASLKFNILLSSFLIKIVEEKIEKKLKGISGSEFEKTVDLRFYDLINNEIEQDYQSLPVLFYFRILLSRINIYQVEDDVKFFLYKIDRIKDLSVSKNIIQIKELISFSEESERFRIEWIEYDSIGSNDKRIYRSLNMKAFSFLKQKYLVFPDPEHKKNNQWIRDLRKADSGEIELIELNIQCETSPETTSVRKIFYTPINSQFIVLLKEFIDVKESEIIGSAARKQIADFHKGLKVVDFTLDETHKEKFKADLKSFGNHLKKTYKNID